MNKTIFCGVLLSTLWTPTVWADRLSWPAETPAVYQRECGSCHLAYHPALLATADWQKLTANLAHHFGTDATLTGADLQQVTAFLQRFGGDTRRPGLAESLRITRTPRFSRKHDEVPARWWKDPKVKSAANCEACHAGAAEGRFSEHDVRLPGVK